MTAGDLDSHTLLGRIVRPADFVRVLTTPLRLRSPHFAVHHLSGRPLPPRKPVAVPAAPAPDTARLSTELSTGGTLPGVQDVDDSRGAATRPDDEATMMSPRGAQRWLGLVVPKKNAKRAVTRVLVKRQIRTIASECSARLEPGLWVVRLRAPFDVKQFPSASSDALRAAVRAELRALFERAAAGERDAFKPRPPRDPRPGSKAPRQKGRPVAAAVQRQEGPPCAA